MQVQPQAHGELVINMQANKQAGQIYQPSAVASETGSIQSSEGSKRRSPLWTVAIVLVILLLLANLGLLIGLTVNNGNDDSAPTAASPANPQQPTAGTVPTTTQEPNVPEPVLPEQYSTDYITATFNPYPASDAQGSATLDRESQVWITENEGGFMIHYVLTGLPEAEPMGAFSVFTGTQCTTLDAPTRGFVHTPVLTALWSKEVGETMARGTVEVARTGFGLSQVVGHALVVQEQSGKRVGCGELRYQHEHLDVDHLTAKFEDYPESEAKGVATLAEDSQVWVTQRENGYRVHYFLTGLPASEEKGGIHIHTGTSCANHELVLGHYYSTPEDPWTTVWSKNAGSTVAFGSVDVATPGFPLETNEGHAFVVHEESGKRIGCGVLAAIDVGSERLRETISELQAQNDALRAALIAANSQ